MVKRGLSLDFPSHIFTQDKKRIKRTFREIGNELRDAARAAIRSGSKGKNRRISQPGQAPVSRTGKLARSLRVKVFSRGYGASVKEGQVYGKMLETGAVGGGGRKGSRNTNRKGKLQAASTNRVLAPRPYLSTALASRKQSIEQRVREAFENGIEFKRQKIK